MKKKNTIIILIIKENLGNCKYNLYYKIDFVENTYGKFLLAL